MFTVPPSIANILASLSLLVELRCIQPNLPRTKNRGSDYLPHDFQRRSIVYEPEHMVLWANGWLVSSLAR